MPKIKIHRCFNRDLRLLIPNFVNRWIVFFNRVDIRVLCSSWVAYENWSETKNKFKALSSKFVTKILP